MAHMRIIYIASKCNISIQCKMPEQNLCLLDVHSPSPHIEFFHLRCQCFSSRCQVLAVRLCGRTVRLWRFILIFPIILDRFIILLITGLLLSPFRVFLCTLAHRFRWISLFRWRGRPTNDMTFWKSIGIHLSLFRASEASNIFLGCISRSDFQLFTHAAGYERRELENRWAPLPSIWP